MGSAFTPVKTRGSSPMPSSASGLHKPGPSRPSKRTRQRSYQRPSQTMSALDVVDEEPPADDAATASTAAAASEASSKASRHSQPPLLDFIGSTCVASAWFTSCFPCAVVDINDSDTFVVDKLSRESAMHVMYSSRHADEAAPQKTGCDALIHPIPPVVAERGNQEEDAAADTISLDDDAGHPCPMPITSERPNPGIALNRGSPSFQGSSVSKNPISSPPKSPPREKKKKKFGMKMFGRNRTRDS